jgi:hypothetical protein
VQPDWAYAGEFEKCKGINDTTPATSSVSASAGATSAMAKPHSLGSRVSISVGFMGGIVALAALHLGS